MRKSTSRNIPTPRNSSPAARTSSTKLKTCNLPFLPFPLSFPLPNTSDLPSTPGKDLEAYLNTHYGPGNPIYEDLCALTIKGIEEGWAANIPITGPGYRRSKISLPKPETRYFSITTVYTDSVEEFAGQHHSHPYGEINCVVCIDEGTELKGMQGWQGRGW